MSRRMGDFTEFNVVMMDMFRALVQAQQQQTTAMMQHQEKQMAILEHGLMLLASQATRMKEVLTRQKRSFGAIPRNQQKRLSKGARRDRLVVSCDYCGKKNHTKKQCRRALGLCLACGARGHKVSGCSKVANRTPATGANAIPVQGNNNQPRNVAAQGQQRQG